ncbi:MULTISPECIES: serine hydrolase domain-containing protein [Kitasatospora]|uniref:Putative peptidase S12 family protein n=1 Tax=Kitasatospora setae (strain ATCC 33774 / DSM 43861 / JCM 3304 / KCC A-0304 / NBRC 14216 / KM-6054) TaxID=452652 RepID=E4N1M9_KITSK|nr:MULTISPECIES: serine hydrolase domain-containing protein [Kitasatospora]BAJ32063.1 putative peptidase S12 family protein [Kitasatospora setae KM-6054]
MTEPGGAERWPYGADVPELLRAYGVPGCSVAVRDADGRERAWAFGQRTAAGGGDRAVGTGTLFQACSLSKPVTALGVLLLAERGELDLDADVNERLAGWRIPPSGGWQPAVTARRLLSHTAGLGPSGFPGYPAGAELPTLLQVLAGTAPANTPGVRPVGLPGFGYAYSGGGTTVLQLLLESVTGRPAAELLRDLVLAPLGMTAARFATAVPADLAAHGHRRGGAPVPGGWARHPELCAAGLWATPAELLRLAAAFQGPATPIGPAAARAALTPHAQVPPGGASLAGLDRVGLGLFLRTDPAGAVSWFGHAGGNDGYRCYLLAETGSGRAAAVMTNGDGGHALLSRLIPAIAAHHGWTGLDFTPPYDPPAPVPPGLRPGRWRRTADPAGPGLELALRDGRLELDWPGQPALPLFTASATELLAEDVDLTARLTPAGTLLVEQGGHSVEFAPHEE